MSRSARCVWLLGFALADAVDDGAFVGACTSDKEGDLSHEACFGWCSASQAADHCPWCKCKGCVWCASHGGASDALTAGPTQECQSAIADDVSYEDCQDFCSVSAKETHCQLCKCRACGFCDATCTSAFEEDGPEATCEPWCSEDYFVEHCQRCKCKACSFCKDGPPCSSDVPDDSSFATCEQFCDASFASSHCAMCKCRSCDFCTAASALGTSQVSALATCNSGVEGDASVETCEEFCDVGSKDDHCSLCKCRGCDFCSCHSEHPEDSSVEDCQKWCRDDQIASHCSWCSCKACRFCRVGGKACRSFYLHGDTDYETCDSFCNAQSADTHCSFCKCKGCGFCASHEHTSRGVAAPPPPACFSGKSHDFLYESCERFCKDAEDQQEACKLCKCKGCSTCSSQCSSGVPGDSTTVGCSSSCNHEHAEGFCPMCRCRGCPFCNADGTVSDMSDVSDDKTTCVKANDRDVDHPACYSHCSETNKRSHCETCKCKGCDFCSDFQVCDSGIKGDTKWKECAASCDGGESCRMCRCQGCDSCEALELAKRQPCDSGIIGDTAYETCLGGICNGKQGDAHCQMCRCKACSFCDGFGEDDAEEEEEAALCTSAYEGDTSFPTCDSFCSPAYASNHCVRCKCKECSFCKETAAACDAGHVADGKTERCAAWCAATQLPVENTCSFCSCRRCKMCEGVDYDDRPTGNGRGCSVGAELLVVSVKKDDERNMHHDVRVRLGNWQVDGKVKISFEGGPKVHFESGSEAHVTLLSQEAASRVFTFSLGAQPGPLNTFGFRFSLGRAELEITSTWPQLLCWNIDAAPPARPQPPPPPYTPFTTGTLSEVQPKQPHFAHAPNYCRLGGRLRIEKQWAGGTSFQASVVMALWRAGAIVSLDFWTPLDEEDRDDVAQIGVQHATGAEVLRTLSRGTVRFRLNGEPAVDELGRSINGFNFIGHGGVVHGHPIITCTDLPGSDAAPPPPPRARVDASCDPLGLMYSVLDKWNGGFKAACAVTHWVAGAGVRVHFTGGHVQLLDSWSASAAVRSGSALEMVLGEGPDPENHGFSFTARGDSSSAAMPEVSCRVDAIASLIQVPAGLCGMGAAYKVVAPVTEGAPHEVKVRLHQWEIGAVVVVEFAERVEASQPRAAATRQSNALGNQHTFELGDFPDADHGFAFEATASSLEVLRISCEPMQQSSPPAPAVARGTPGAPGGLVLRSATCDMLELSWQPAVDGGFAVSSYVVSYRRRDAAEEGVEELAVGPSTTATLRGLAGSTTYYIKVRARNERGSGHFSARLAAATSSGGGAPQTATAAPSAVESPDCHSVTLRLPPLRTGCRGDAYLAVQRREVGDAASDWATVVERSAMGTATVGGLEPFAVNEFRLVAHNDDGEAPASLSSGFLLTDAFEQVGMPPTVVPTSSASFAISWAELAGACRPALRFQLLYTRSAAADEEGWMQLATNVEGSTYDAFPLRCVAPGCAFRVKPLGLRGAEQLSPHSAPRTTLPLPGLAEGSTRLELRLRSEQRDRDQLLMRRQVEDEIERALAVPRGTVDVRDIFGFGRYVVLDMHEAASQLGGTAAVVADELAQQLQLLVQDTDGTSPLRDCEVTSELDAQEGVQMLLADGRMTPVRVGSAAAKVVTRLPRAKVAINPLGAAGRITFFLTVATVFGACVVSAARRQATLMQYGRVAPDESAEVVSVRRVSTR